MGITEFLRTRVPFLEGLTEDQATFLAPKAEQLSFKKGQTVLFKGVSVDGLHVVAQGKVEVLTRPEKTKDWMRVAELNPGDVFGEMSIVEFSMAGATIRCAEDDTKILVLPEEPFRKLLAADPDLAKRTMALIESRRAAQQPKTAG
ncbi:MAG: cyclic nucleotide-binding domain-containing protein [Elusimicrobiota bacterium]